MTNYLDLNIKEINKLLKTKKIKPIDLVNEVFERIENNSNLNYYITLNKEEAIKRAKELENKEVDNLLFGLPIAIKDNIVTKDLKTTCGSKMLDNFIPTYDATVIEKLKKLGMIIIGKTNMDEFASGSTGNNSYYQTAKNSYDETRICGGSSSGSAGTVGKREIGLALGSDTGGSIRQPASFCGVVGMKPTYGRVSRYGLVSFCSSLDQIGPITNNVLDNAILLEAISGIDNKDLTSFDQPIDFTTNIAKDIKGLKIGVPNYFMEKLLNEDIKSKFLSTLKILEQLGAKVNYIDIDYLDLSSSLYEIISYCELSSNLARFDGIRYGYTTDNYQKTREEGFQQEIKRRIVIGNYLLSGDNVVNYYEKALKIRNKLQKSLFKAFKEVDLIITPTTGNFAPKIDEGFNQEVEVLNDNLDIFANMGGLPALSMPINIDKGLPIGLQIVGNLYEESKIYNLAFKLEEVLKNV